MELHLSDWDAICAAFSEMFNGLGDVSTSEETVEYSSCPPDVATGIILTCDGSIIANMPLHNIDSNFARVRFADSMGFIQLIGPNLEYTYKIPPGIKRK